MACSFTLCVVPALAQSQPHSTVPTPGQPAPAPHAVPATPADDDESFITDKDMRARKAEMERELRKLRVKYFGSIRKVEIRQEGIAQLRQYTDPLIFPALVKVFEREHHDVRLAILDHLVDQASEQADVTLAWMAAFDRDQAIREEALTRLSARIRATGLVPQRIKYMVYQAMRSGSDDKINGAAQLAQSLNFFDAIPWMISAQFGGPNTGGGGGTPEPRGDLAYIVVGTQTAFVSDLTPVVSDSAVAFDPTLTTLTTGTILRVQDAVVTTYRTILQTVLVKMTSDAWGQSTEGLGYDGGKWWNWYRQDYLPLVGEKLAREEREKTADHSAESPTPADQPGSDPDPKAPDTVVPTRR